MLFFYGSIMIYFIYRIYSIHSPKGLLGTPYFDPLSPSELPLFYVALFQQGAESIL